MDQASKVGAKCVVPKFGGEVEGSGWRVAQDFEFAFIGRIAFT